MDHAPRKVKWSVLVLWYFVLKNELSVKNERSKEIVYDNGDNAKEKGGTKTGDKAPNFNKSDK